MPPVRAAGVAARVSRHPASDGHSASRSSPCGRVAGRWPARPATIADRTTQLRARPRKIGIEQGNAVLADDAGARAQAGHRLNDQREAVREAVARTAVEPPRGRSFRATTAQKKLLSFPRKREGGCRGV